MDERYTDRIADAEAELRRTGIEGQKVFRKLQQAKKELADMENWMKEKRKAADSQNVHTWED